jgi:sugar porter (SP) family MFS transporter
MLGRLNKRISHSRHRNMTALNDPTTSPVIRHSNKRQFRWYNVFIILFMSLGSIEYGYSASIIATTLAQPSFISYFELNTRDDASTLAGLMNSLYQAGGFIGVWTVSVVSDRYGRKQAIVYSAVVNVVAAAGLTGSTGIGMFLAFRFVAGWGGWTIVTAIPIWMNEVSPPSIRGILVDCHNVGFLLGYNIATYFGYAFYHLAPTNNWGWRGGMVLHLFWVLALLSGIHWLPESPRWLMMKDRHEEAAQVLQRLHTPEEALVEAAQIRQSIESDRHHISTWWSMIAKPSYRKRTLFAMGMALSIQTSGILVVTNYGPTIYASLGFDTNKQLLYQIGWCVVALGTGFMSFLLIDRFPRNKLLSFGVGGCAMCLAIVCGLIGKFASPQALENPNQPALSATIAFIYLVNCFYQLGLGKTHTICSGRPSRILTWMY